MDIKLVHNSRWPSSYSSSYSALDWSDRGGGHSRLEIGLIELRIGLIGLGIGLTELGIGLIKLGIGLIDLGIGLMELGMGLRINNARRTILALLFFPFLVADTQLYKRLCPSVGASVRGHQVLT